MEWQKVHARKKGLDRVVTVAMDAVEFKRPVFVGDLVSLVLGPLLASCGAYVPMNPSDPPEPTRRGSLTKRVKAYHM